MAVHETTPLLGSQKDVGCESGLEPREENVDAKLRRAQVISLITTLSGVLLAYADGAIALSIHEPVASHFDCLEYSSWLITGFTIGYCVTLPMYGQLSDAYGRQGPLIFAYCIFCLGNFITGIGRSYVEVIAGQVIAGFGGSGMISLVSIIIIDIAPPSEVAIWRSYVSVVLVLGQSIGGPIGGLLVETVGWRWAFLGQVPIGIICCIATHLSLKAIPKTVAAEGQATSESDAVEVEKPTIWTFDFPGAITLGIAITSLLVVIDMKDKFAWDSPLMTTAVVAGSLCTILFLASESFGKKKPLIPLPLLKTEVGIFCLTQFLMMSGRFGFLAHLAPYFVRTQGASDAQAGSYIIPSSVGNAIGALIAGRTLQKFRSYKKLSLLSLVGSIASSAIILLRWSNNISPWESFEVFFPGVFIGMMLSLQFMGLSLMAPKSQMSTAVSLYYMTQQIGIAIGVSYASTLMSNEYEGALTRALADVPNHIAIIKELILDSSYIMTLPESLRLLVWECYRQSFWVVPALYVGSHVACIIPMLSTTDRLL